MSTFSSPPDANVGSLVRSGQLNTLDARTADAFALLPTNAQIDDGKITYAVDTGTANNYVVALPQTATAYNDGLAVDMRPINTNTGASVIDVDGLGDKSIYQPDGSEISAGDIIVGVPLSLRFSTVTDAFHIGHATVHTSFGAASETASGIIELATAAEVVAGTDALRAVTPLSLANARVGKSHLHGQVFS